MCAAAALTINAPPPCFLLCLHLLPHMQRCIARLGATQCALIFVSGIGGSQEDTVGPNSTLHPRALQWFFEGLYAVPIRVWTQLYPKEQLLVLTMEQLLEDTRRQILRLFEHIGVGDVSGAWRRSRHGRGAPMTCMIDAFGTQLLWRRQQKRADEAAACGRGGGSCCASCCCVCGDGI